MALPLAEQRALKRLEPTILNHKNAMEFISSIGHLRSKYSKDVSIEKFWDDYVQLSIEIDWVKEGVNNQKEMMRAKKLMRTHKEKKLEFSKILKKFNGIFWNIGDERIEFIIEQNEFVSFSHTLKHIQKSDQRIVRWAIAYLFYKGKNEIKISEFKKYSKIIKSNLEKHIKKICGNKWASVDITLNLHKNGSIIDLKINHKQLDDKKIDRFLLDELEFSSRREAGDLEEHILDLLDMDAMSLKQLSKTLETSPQQLSPIFNKLKKEKQIRYASDGDKGERFFITNCDNCFRNIEKEKCRSDAIEQIAEIMKEALDVDLDKKAINKVFKENQSLLKLSAVIYDNSSVKDTEVYPNYQKGLQALFASIYENYTQNLNPERKKLVKLDDLFAKLGDSFTPGFLIGQTEMAGLLQRAMDNVDVKFTPIQERKIRDEIDKMRNEAN